MWEFLKDFYKFRADDLILVEVEASDGQKWEFGTGIPVEDKAQKTIQEFYTISLISKDAIRGTGTVFNSKEEAIKYVKEYNEKINPTYDLNKWT